MSIGPYGFQDAADIAIAPAKEAYVDTLYEECIPTYAAACLLQLAYKITGLNYFAVLGTAAYAAFSICLARKVFKDFTFFHYCERKCFEVVQRYPLLAVVSMVVSAHIRTTLPAASLTLTVATGMMIGFTLRIKWLSGMMHWSN